MEYFAYGSNLFTPRLRKRVPHASFVAVTRLPDHALKFHKRSDDGSAKCNVIPSRGGSVFGVVFEVPQSEKPNLDRAEGLGEGYAEQELIVFTADEQRRIAVAYVADPAYIDDSLFPYTWYKDYVLRGAQEHNLSPQYVAKIAAVEACYDPDAAREAREQAILRVGDG